MPFLTVTLILRPSHTTCFARRRTCFPASGAFGYDLETIPRSDFSNENVSGYVDLTHVSAGGFKISYDVTLINDADARNLTASKLSIYTSSPCTTASLDFPLLEVPLSRSQTSVSPYYHETPDTITSVELAPLRGTSYFALMTASGHALGNSMRGEAQRRHEAARYEAVLTY